MAFLADRDARTWRVGGAERGVYWTGEGNNPQEVVLTEFLSEPSRGVVASLWRERQDRRPSPVLLVAAWPSPEPTHVWLCGPLGDDPPMVVRDVGQAERIARQALEEPSRTFAAQYLVDALRETDDPLPGVRNDGLLATHELRYGVPTRPDWAQACGTSSPLMSLRGRDLVHGLGYEINQRGDHALLRAAEGGQARAVAVFLERNERADSPSQRFSNKTPVTFALNQADREGLRWVLALRGGSLRLYSTATSGASGQRGRTETFVEVDLPLLAEDRAGYVSLLFSADALATGGTFDEVAEASRQFTTDLSERLRERIYSQVVPRLALSVANRHEGTVDKQALDGIYHTALTILFRLLFVAYAEDRRLLPYEISDDYRTHSLSAIAQGIAADINAGNNLGFDDPLGVAPSGPIDDHADDLWTACLTLFSAVNEGHTRWGIPAYNGGLFTDTSTEGAAINSLSLSNSEFGPALTALLVDHNADGGIGPIDFRSLSVREFGTIYEGLLESEVAVADQDLALVRDKKGNDVYAPATEGDEVEVAQGGVYLHNRSGARKSTGSYFTKPFAVDHLIATALLPALRDHLDEVETLADDGDEAAAAERLFDFRVADIAMGSGHFLTAAIDAIEAGVTDLLTRRPIPHVTRELERLHNAAVERLGDAAPMYEIETTQVLRRLIARRCIYGVDLNPIAVELARVSIWIHTFVPGLPLSFLDRTLIAGNSLTGIGTVAEAVNELVSDDAQASLFDDPIREALAQAEEPLRRLGTISDATVDDVRDAEATAQQARDAVQPVADRFNLIVARRLGEIDLPSDVIADDPPADLAERAREIADDLGLVHFPIAFPEVFVRDRGGFDVLLGNPPWEKPQVESHEFWARHFPGLRGMRTADRDREIARLAADRPDLARQLQDEQKAVRALRTILTSGPYNLGVGHTDLAKIFAWRFWALCGIPGRAGIVLPRAATLAAPGMAEWRNAVLDGGGFADVCMLVNRSQWVFDQVHGQYSVGLVAITKLDSPLAFVFLDGPYRSLDDYQAGRAEGSRPIPVEEFRSWSTDASFPLLPSKQSTDIFRQLARHPRLGDHSHLNFRPVQGDINASAGRPFYVDDPSAEARRWPVYSGGSFNLWTPETGQIYAWVDREVIVEHLATKRRRQATHSTSAFFGLGEETLSDPHTLPCYSPRIAFRDVARATDQRTVIAALIPPKVIPQHTAPYLLRRDNSAREEAFVLGLLASIPLDWWARRTVEAHVTFSIVSLFPVPTINGEHPGFVEVVECVGRLAAVDERYSGWADEVGVPVGSVPDATAQDDLIARIDAAVAKLYGLDASDVAHIFETFHHGWDYRARLDAVIGHFESFEWDPAPVG